MREIEFRGKLKSTDKWAYGNLDIKKTGTAIITPDETVLGSYGQVDPETAGQYTGLKDKNEKKIFEGDILQYEGGGIYRVIFDEMMIMCPQDNIEMPSPGYYGILIGDKTKELCPLGVTQRLAKVIGNTYDNPELLEGGN